MFRFLSRVLFFLILLSQLSYAGALEGAHIFKSKNCSSCHAALAPQKGKTGKEVSPEKAPPLWYAGSKFKGSFLKDYLSNPIPIRPMAYNSLTEKNPANHPKLSKKDAEEVAGYLMTLKSKAVSSGLIKPRAGTKGRIIFERKLACYGCHIVKEKDAFIGGLSGPMLVDANKRLNPDWIYSFLKNPGFFEPRSAMPVYKGIINDREMMTLAEYVSTL